MKQKTIIIILSIALVLSIGGGIAVYAASNIGTRDDPLITKSYLDQQLTPGLIAELERGFNEKIAELEARLNDAIAASGGITADTYAVVTLASGQSLRGSEGTELLLRSGSGTCGAPSGGVLDLSTGETIQNGASLAENHMYLITAEGDGVAASSGATLLVRGTYTIE